METNMDIDLDMDDGAGDKDPKSRAPAPAPAPAPAARAPEQDDDPPLLLYSPLDEDEDEIRVISFPPQPPSGHAPIRCHLETVSLRSATPAYQDFVSRPTPANGDRSRRMIREWRGKQLQRRPSSNHSGLGPGEDQVQVPPTPCHRFKWGDYAALSYAWGEPDPNATHRVMINGQMMLVGRNLEGALRALVSRQEFQRGNGYRLWVDALCINQADLEERSRQVCKMRTIYGDAWAVIAWLGPAADESNEAIDLVRSLSMASAKGHGQQVQARLHHDPDCLGSGSWRALHELMQRPYWSRLWVIQELVLGSSAVSLRCGRRVIEWPSFCAGIGFLSDYLWTLKDWLLKREVSSSSSLAADHTSPVWLTGNLHLVKQDLWALSLRREQGRNHLSFDRLLVLGNSAKSRDARDKVYGLVGMMDVAIAEHLVPDYKSSPSAIFARVARIFIQSTKSLDPIREGNLWGEADSPSWAADWTWTGRLRHSRPETRLWGPFWNRDGPPQLANEAAPYRASGNSCVDASFSEDGLHLHCQGFLVDRIGGLAARGTGYYAWSTASIVQPTRGSSIYGGPFETAEALWHALVADRIADGSKANGRQKAILSLPSTFQIAAPQFQRLGWKWLYSQAAYYFRWEQWRLANRGFLLGNQPLGEYFTDTLPLEASEYDYTEVYTCFDRTCKGRRFMTTENGYLGWAPDNMYGSDHDQTRKADLIAIIFGCSTPIVIRPCGDLFQVVGEAYVQGLMDGEAMEFLRSGNAPLQRFTFC